MVFLFVVIFDKIVGRPIGKRVVSISSPNQNKFNSICLYEYDLNCMTSTVNCSQILLLTKIRNVFYPKNTADTLKMPLYSFITPNLYKFLKIACTK